jgi:RNA polymerase sigma-70 factor (ECF subfamily)
MTTSSVIPRARNPVDLTSWDLVAAAQHGDRDAFGQLYGRYVAVVFRYVLARTGDWALAEDLTSETFLRALRRIDSVSNTRGRDVGAWFVTIARNLILDHLKCSHSKLEITTRDILDASTEPAADGVVISRETADVVLAGVSRLSDVQRECVILRHLHGLAAEEVAAAAGCSPGAAKSRTYRGLLALAEMPELQALWV